MTRRPRFNVACALAVLIASMGGCQLVGGMLDSAERTGAKDVAAAYRGLEGKSFAVIVTADRSIQGEHPGLVEYVNAKIVERLTASDAKPRGAGFVPAGDVAVYQAKNPGWVTRTMSQLATDLGGVERLVLVEIPEYRLTEPGNPYEWDGSAAAIVSVYETGAGSERTSDYASFDRTITVKFPDQKSMTPNDIPRQGVTSALALRLAERTAWLFLDHKEPIRQP